ncbi:MAG TPA: hypothetical protein VGH46_01725 [Gaiellaceae bacterium]
MQLVVSDDAAELIRERGGHLNVWPKKARCCGGLITLRTSTSAPHRDFRQVASGERFQVLVPATLSPLPDELHVELRRHPRRVEAYWNGCAWVI